MFSNMKTLYYNGNSMQNHCRYRQYVKKESDLFCWEWEIYVKKFRENDAFHQIFVLNIFKNLYEEQKVKEFEFRNIYLKISNNIPRYTLGT